MSESNYYASLIERSHECRGVYVGDNEVIEEMRDALETLVAKNSHDAAEIERLREIEKKAFFAGFSSGFSSCSAGLPGLTHNKERDYEVWRCRQATAGEGQRHTEEMTPAEKDSLHKGLRDSVTTAERGRLPE